MFLMSRTPLQPSYLNLDTDKVLSVHGIGRLDLKWLIRTTDIFLQKLEERKMSSSLGIEHALGNLIPSEGKLLISFRFDVKV